MTNEPPTLETYEEMADVEFDLSDTPLSESDINQNLETIFNGGSNE